MKMQRTFFLILTLVIISSLSILPCFAQYATSTQLKTPEQWEGGFSLWTVVFSPDGGTLASVDDHGRVLLWDMDPCEPERVPEDVNGDGVVNIQDLVAVADALGETGETPADVNGDGIVNIQDLVAVAAALGETAGGIP